MLEKSQFRTKGPFRDKFDESEDESFETASYAIVCVFVIPSLRADSTVSAEKQQGGESSL